jgi:hypothetical protein
MPTRRRNITVEPRPNGQWAVQRDGTKRASSLHTTQRQAESAAKTTARRDGLEVVVKGQDGTILRRDSYGNDPPRRRG